MEHESKVIEFMGIGFSVNILISVAATCFIVFLFCYVCTRNLTLRPKKGQLVIEYIADFVKNMIASSMDWKTGEQFFLLGFTLFLFIWVANVLGLFLILNI